MVANFTYYNELKKPKSSVPQTQETHKKFTKPSIVSGQEWIQTLLAKQKY